MNVDIIELPCPACGGMNAVAESAIPLSGEINCVHCGDAISFRTAPEELDAELERGLGALSGAWETRHPSSLPPPLSEPERVVEARADYDEWADTGNQGERHVRCPSCGHAFDPDSRELSNKTILVVEDTDFFLQLATEVLGERYSVVPTRTAAEARRALATRPIDLVVLDLTLPDAEGTEVLRALPRPDIPTLVYTSRDETALIGNEWRLLQSLGARDVVHKGLNIEESLLRKVGELLDGARPRALR